MKILYRNATAQLFEKVNSLAAHPNSWRCIHLKLSHRREQYNNKRLLAYFLIKGIAEILSDDEGYIYLCGDGDIFILFQGAMRPVWNKLGSQFADIDMDYDSGQASGNLFAIYDLSKDWSELCRISYAKSLHAKHLGDAIEVPYHRHAGRAIAEAAGEM